jgi:hypothetical protein
MLGDEQWEWSGVEWSGVDAFLLCVIANDKSRE